MASHKDEVTRLGSMLWIVSLLRRHYYTYLVIVITSFVVAVGIHIFYPQFYTAAKIYINSTDDSQLLNRIGRMSGQYVSSYKEKDDVDKYLKIFDAMSFQDFVKDKMREEWLATKSEPVNEEELLESTEGLLGSITFKKADSDVILVTGASTDPEEVLESVIRVAKYARKAIIDFELTEISDTQRYLNTEMDKSRKRISQLNDDIELFKKEKQDIQFSISSKAAPLNSSISRLREDLEVTRVQISKNEILLKQLDEQAAEASQKSGEKVSTSDILHSRGRISDTIQSVNKELQNLYANRKALLRRLKQLQSDYSADYEQRVYEFQKQIELEYSFYETLQQNLFQTGIQSISVRNRVRTVDFPNSKMIRQKLPLMYKLILALTLSTIVTIVLIALFEYFFPVVISKNNVIELGYNNLSHIPKLRLISSLLPSRWISREKDPVVQICADNPESQAGAVFRYLRVRFLQSIANAPTLQKVFAIGSARPNEGKSFVTINFAVSLASVGKKVLLIDSDERISSLSKALSDLTGQGLIQYCKGEVGYREVIRNSAYPNLDVLPVGYHKEGEQVDILSSGMLKQICDELRNEYDFIFIDTPAFYAGADALLVYEIVDRPIIVIESGRTSMVEAHNIYDILRTLGHNTIYSVLNRYTEVFEVKPQSYYYAVPKRSKEEAA